MKRIMIHYINVELQRVNQGVNQYNDGIDFDIIPTKLHFSGDLTNKRILLCEKKDSNIESFDFISQVYLDNFKSQAPENFERYYHFILPNYDSHRRGFEAAPTTIIQGKNKKLLQILLYNFSRDNWDAFFKKYRNFLNSINGEELEKDYEFIVTETIDHYDNYVNIIPEYDYTEKTKASNY